MKKIISIFLLILLIGVYVTTFVLAFSEDPFSNPYFKGALFLSVFLPVLIYGYSLIIKSLRRRDDYKKIPDETEE